MESGALLQRTFPRHRHVMRRASISRDALLAFPTLCMAKPRMPLSLPAQAVRSTRAITARGPTSLATVCHRQLIAALAQSRGRAIVRHAAEAPALSRMGLASMSIPATLTTEVCMQAATMGESVKARQAVLRARLLFPVLSLQRAMRLLQIRAIARRFARTKECLFQVTEEKVIVADKRSLFALALIRTEGASVLQADLATVHSSRMGTQVVGFRPR